MTESQLNLLVGLVDAAGNFYSNRDLTQALIYIKSNIFLQLNKKV